MNAGTADHQSRFDALLFRRVLRLTVPYWRRRQAWPAWVGLGVLLCQGMLLSYLVVRAAALLKEVTDGLLSGNRAAFEAALLAYLLVFTAKTLVPQARIIVDALVEAGWSRWLGQHVIDRYLAERTYYNIRLEGDLDNPDQRIAESVGPFVEAAIQILQWTVSVAARLGAAVAVFVSLDARFLLIVPMLGLAQVAATILTISPEVRRKIAVQVAEGDLRHDLVHIRDHAEAIAFYGGEATERRSVMACTRAAADRIFDLARFQAGVYLTVHAGTSFAWMALPYAVLSGQVASGAMSYGTLAQATAITLMMRGVIDTISTIVETFGELAARVSRLAPLQERFDALAQIRAERAGITVQPGHDRVTIEELTLETPDGARRLVSGLSLVVRRGESVVIVGETGVGKSSLLRAMAGLWDRGQGRLTMPPVRETLFLPQRPYLPAGSLREQLLYPHGSGASDAELLAILEAVRLPDLAETHGGLSAVRDWTQILSGGEQQRLAFARALVGRPAFVFLDEATSALDAATEAQLYAELVRTGASVISVGHRLGIVAHHTHILTLRSGGRWDLAAVAAWAQAS